MITVVEEKLLQSEKNYLPPTHTTFQTDRLPEVRLTHYHHNAAF